MKSSSFQIAVIGVFVALIFLGAGIFATKGGGSGGAGVGNVSIWGDIDPTVMETALATLRSGDKSFANVTYVYKKPALYENALVEAMASGKGPDLFFVSPEMVGSFANKITTIPYSAVSQQAFTSAYIDEGSLFLTAQGPSAIPILIDPLVMYWNRDTLAAASVAQAPKDWDTILTIAPSLTTLSTDGNTAIQKSAVALGGWGNIAYAKEVLSTLIIQAGDPIVAEDPTSGKQVAFLGEVPEGAATSPAASALQFYTEFSNPVKTSYSWNRSLPEAADAFVSGKLAFYFGFASDYPTLLARNPNLHIAVAVIPQIKDGGVRLTYGRMTGVAIARTAANPSGALTVAELMGGVAGVSALASAAKLPPVRRDVTMDTSASAAASVFVQSALMARAWLDPNPTQTDDIFKTMIESVVTGASTPDRAVAEAARALGLFYHNASGSTQPQ
ncbi:MAG: extracellular solute-binding protein [bacterium]